MSTRLAMLLSVLAACGGASGGMQAGGGSATGGGSAAGGGTGGGGTSAGGGSSTGGGTAAAGGGGVIINSATSCPHVDLGSSTTVTYHGDTTGLPDWVESQRLEWMSAPDDSLTFVAPEAGMYGFSLNVQPSDAGNFQEGVSVRDFGGTLYSTCPTAGMPAMIDGVFEEPSYPVQLTAGQRVLMYVSAPYWSTPLQGPYTLTIMKQ
jgi:hypothetical protein